MLPVHVKNEFVMKLMRICFVSITIVKLFCLFYLRDIKACLYLPVQNIMVVQSYKCYIPLDGNTVSRKNPDNLFQAVIQTHLLKLVKSSNYLTIFQMFHQTVTLNGIEKFSTTSFRNFHFKSILSTETEAISIKNRPDINAHLSKLRLEHIISEYVESGAREFYNISSIIVEYLKHKVHYTIILRVCLLGRSDFERISKSVLRLLSTARKKMRISMTV